MVHNTIEIDKSSGCRGAERRAGTPTHLWNSPGRSRFHGISRYQQPDTKKRFTLILMRPHELSFKFYIMYMGGWRKPSVKVDDEICSISMVIKKDVNTDFMWPWYRTHKGLYTVQYFSPVLQYSQILDVPFDDTELKLMTQRRGGGGLPSCPVAQVGGYSLQALS